MTKKDYLKYWQKGAQDALETAQALFNSKKFHHCLFFCHLALEKIMKGLVVHKTNQHPIITHDLKKLTKQAKINLTPQRKKELEEITSWNIEARYDTIKREFYKKAGQKFTQEWFKKSREIYLWLKKQY